MKWLWVGLLGIAIIFGVVAGIGALLPENFTATRSSHFDRPPQAVWNVIAGPPTWRPDVKSFENLSSSDGHRTWKEIDARGSSVTYDAIEETPPFRLVMRIVDSSRPFGGYWIDEIAPEPGGCRLQITQAGEIYNPIFRFLSRFVFGYTAMIDANLSALHAKLNDRGS